MERVYIILTFLSLLSEGLQSQVFQIVEEPVCWTTGAADSSLTRASYVSVSGAVLTVFYINQDGASVDVSAGGNFSFGRCGCCTNVPPSYAEDAPYLDSIATLIGVIPIPPPPTFDSTVIAVSYASINNITDPSQITATFSSADLPDLVLNGVGYTSNANGSITTTYNQATPTLAEVSVYFYAYFPPAVGSTPQPVIAVAANTAGSITLISDQFF